MSESQMTDSPQVPAPDLTTQDDDSLQALGKFLMNESQGFSRPASGNASRPATDDADLFAAPAVDVVVKTDSVQQRVMAVNAAAIPLLEAAQPLLRALSEMPEAIPSPAHASVLKRTLVNEINLFSVVCDETNIPWKKMAIVRYCLCTALDEAAHATSWGLACAWSQSNLLNHFEGDNDGGNKFFLLVGRLSVNPQEYADVLEIMLRILGLGLEGRYSIIENGERQLTKIRQQLLTLLQSTRDTVPAALSPHALALRGAVKRPRYAVPVRVTALFGVLLVVGSFITCKYLLASRERAAELRIAALSEVQGFAVPPAQRLRLAVLLKEEIKQQLVSVDETSSRSKVIFHSDAMFQVGSANVRPEMMGILKRVADEIRRVNGRVAIVGHTDSLPIHKPGITDNQMLSEMRAADVANVLRTQGVPGSYIRIEGMGDRQPVSQNDDAKGRALNRRVEIFVTYK
ncbi:type VI secretion system protein TssL, long form [Siccibacter turicensis]|uniref:Type VI secretion system protein TssL n=1 Tax=Siccibacter turicensis TaxID=357233 RepID=A0A2P8VMD7_9ENTR|nr:type VI secretion system protein TssL, long form [Siccibacter turicensis]PSN08729.1 type VI secretion system protein TssL [Siccibacter turicensis]